MKPIIGIVSRPDKLQSGRNVDIIYSSIRKNIVESNGVPLVITPPVSTVYQEELEQKKNIISTLEPILSLCDGFIFQGGDDFYQYDLDILDYAYQHDIPSFGICLGMQMMSVYKNGSLKPVEFHHELKDYVHQVKIKKDSKLFDIYKNEFILVNSRHHDQVATTDLTITATSLDGVIEAVEDLNKTFFVGVQWHPEDMIAYDEMTKQLWKIFIEKCKENQK